MNLKTKKILVWIPVFAIATAIFIFSSQPAEESTVVSQSLSQVILNIANDIHMINIQTLNLNDILLLMGTPIRKSAHTIEFGILTLSLLAALHTWGLKGKKLLWSAFIITVLYACSDEIHQLFVPGRAGLFTDILIDSLGAAIVTVIARRHMHTTQ